MCEIFDDLEDISTVQFFMEANEKRNFFQSSLIYDDML